MASLRPDDGHDLCDTCLGVKHRREALSDNACPNCAVMPLSLCATCLARFEQPADWSTGGCHSQLLVGQSTDRTRPMTDTQSSPRKRTKKGGAGRLTAKMDSFSLELAQMRPLLQNLQAEADHMGRIGNSLSHLLLGLSTSLETVELDVPTQGLVDASLQAFALMSRELGRLLSTLVQARRQVWFAQSPQSDTGWRTLRGLPVVPGELFGSAALEALELVELHGRAPRHVGTGPAAAPSRRYPVPTPSFREPRQPTGAQTQRGRT